MSKFCKVLYLVLAIVTMLEYWFVTGMFTSFIVMFLIWAAGIINFVVSLKEKNYNEAALYVISTIALNLGYWKLM